MSNPLQKSKTNTRIFDQMSKYDTDESDWIVNNPQKPVYLFYESEHLCFRLYTPNPSHLEEIMRNFREINKATFFQQRWSTKTLDDYMYSVSPLGYFQPGLVRNVIKFCIESPIINPMKLPASHIVSIPLGTARFMNEWCTPLAGTIGKIIQENGKIDISNISVDRAEENGKEPLLMRGYQEEAIEKLLSVGKGRGMIESATASGKSLIIANLIYTLCNLKIPNENPRSLIYVPNIQLVEQFYGDLLSYGYTEDEICKCSGSVSTADKKKMAKTAKTAKIIIANSDWLRRHFAEIGNIDILVVDEAHCCKPDSKGFMVLRDKLFNTKLRFGFSGTMPQKYNLWELTGLIGPIVYKVNVTDLQDLGFLTKLKITRVKVIDKVVADDTDLLFNINSKWRMDDYNEDMGGVIGPHDAWFAEQEWLTAHCSRIFAPLVHKLAKDPQTPNCNTLVLFDRIELGHNLFAMFEEECIPKGLGVKYIDGSTPVAEREDARKTLEAKSGNILLGQSSILSTGINIKNLSRIVLLSAGKSQARIVQAIGRTLRLLSGKTHSELVDVEMNYKYAKKHAAERRSLYAKWYHKKKFDNELEFEV